jgi:two-component system chemotaxis response regulator CheY
MLRASAFRIAIVADGQRMRTVVRDLLVRRGYGVAGEAGSALGALALIERTRPDGLLLDVFLGADDGFRLARRVARQWPDVRILMTSVAFTDRFYVLASASGACGFVPKQQLAQAELSAFWGGPTLVRS